MFYPAGVCWGTRVRHLEFGGCCCGGETLRESRQLGLGLERGIRGGQPPWGADIQAGFCTVVTERTFQAETLQRARVCCV